MRDWINVIGWTIALTLLFSLTSRADDYSFKYGMGLQDAKPTGNIKQFSLRTESRVLGPLHDATEGGLWVDNLGDGRRGAVYGKYQLGVKPGAEVGVYASAFWGIELQSTTDTQLGGILQFSQDAGIGIRDETSFVQATYSHVSSAGIWSPNRGRDFVLLSIGLRL
jgi:hypothetical protein